MGKFKGLRDESEGAVSYLTRPLHAASRLAGGLLVSASRAARVKAMKEAQAKMKAERRARIARVEALIGSAEMRALRMEARAVKGLLQERHQAARAALKAAEAEHKLVQEDLERTQRLLKGAA